MNIFFNVFNKYVLTTLTYTLVRGGGFPFHKSSHNVFARLFTGAVIL